MQFDNGTIGDQVNLIITQPGLSSSGEERKKVLQDLEEAVEEVLDDHGADPTMVKVVDGHTFSSIEADCPQCGDRLKLIEPSLDATNGVAATASCECGWYGDAIYRLIDLHETSSLNAEHAEVDGDDVCQDILNDSSSVRLHNVRPKYTPY